MIIAAWAMGVGSCWIGDFKEDKVKQLLNIPDKWKVVALVSFGYPAEKPKPKRKKPIEKIRRESYILPSQSLSKAFLRKE